MPDWLVPAIDDGASVVTANRRLARALDIEYADRAIRAGRAAWASPTIAHYARWLRGLLEHAPSEQARLHLGSQAGRVLWESCLAAELGEHPTNSDDIAGLAHKAQDAWKQARAFDLSADQLAAAARNHDQSVFARAAKRYAATLDERRWVDDAELEHHVSRLLADGLLRVPQQLVMVGFDRFTPARRALCARLEARGTALEWPEPHGAGSIPAGAYRDQDAELRAAGVWARQALARDPQARVGIVVTELEQDPLRVTRLVREGFVPGWQTGPAQWQVNVSLGSRLDSYPLIAVALLAMRWLFEPLTSPQLGMLLRSDLIGVSTSDARSRLELKLRSMPARDWTPGRAQRALERHGGEPDTVDFLARVQALGNIGAEIGGRETPAVWAQRVDRALQRMGWPGQATLGSAQQQLVNRWRRLLNEFAALEPFTGMLSAGDAAHRLRQMARETVFQPQDTGALVSVLGPLEATGLEFDAIRVTGLDGSRWPPPRRPNALIGPRLRITAGLPDATPENTLAFAQRRLTQLAGSGRLVSGSYAAFDGDSAQCLTTLAPVVPAPAAPEDPGWHAAHCRDRLAAETVADPVPPVRPNETVRGGAATVDRQIAEPFAAFAYGRLGISPLEPFAEGITPLMRGVLIHDALSHLYSDCPTQTVIRGWSQAERDQRIEQAVRRGAVRHRIAAGQTLERLLDYEEVRARRLLARVVERDLERPAFAIQSVEAALDVSIGGLTLSLRHDRIDAAEDGRLIVLDYKTGSQKRFLKQGEPGSYQLVLYALGVPDRVEALGLYNVDSLKVGIDGYGLSIDGRDDLADKLDEWTATISSAVSAFAAGDVRLNLVQGSRAARPLALLSRYEERIRDPG